MRILTYKKLSKLPVHRQREILERLHNFLYRRALKLKEHNYCQFKQENGKLTCASTRCHGRSDTSPAWCCQGCKHLSPNGCTVEALACRAWVCESGWNSAVQNKNLNPIVKRARKISRLASQWGLWHPRADKETAIKKGLGELKGLKKWL